MSEADDRVPLGDLSEVTAGPSGALLASLHEGPDGVPVLSPPDLTPDQTVDTRRLRRVPLSATERLKKFALRPGDLLVVRQGTLGRMALVSEEHTDWFYGSSCLRVRPRIDVLLPEYLAAYLSLPSVRKNLLRKALPGTVPSLNSAIVRNFPVRLPPLRRQALIVATLKDIDEQVRLHRGVIDRLETLRPAVLAELVDGRTPA